MCPDSTGLVRFRRHSAGGGRAYGIEWHTRMEVKNRTKFTALTKAITIHRNVVDFPAVVLDLAI